MIAAGAPPRTRPDTAPDFHAWDRRSELPAVDRPGAPAVLDITKYFGQTTGGIRTYLLEKSCYVAVHTDHRQIVVVPGGDDGLALSDGVRWYRLRSPRIPTQPQYRFLLAARQIRRILRHERPAVVEVGSPLLVPWIVAWAARGQSSHLVWHCHSHLARLAAPDPSRAPFLGRLLHRLALAYMRRVAKLFRLVIVGSEVVRNDLTAAGIAHVRCIPLGVDLERFHPGRRAAARERLRQDPSWPRGPTALFLGRLAGEKRLDLVLGAWPEVARRTGATLVIVGDGPLRSELRRLAGETGVVWRPFEQDRERVADLLAAADLYLAPGPAETFGLSALEAAACGTPVLTVDSGGVAEQVARSGGGLSYPLEDPAALIAGAIRLLSAEGAAFGARGQAFAHRHHAWDETFRRLFETYQALDRP